MNNEDVQALMIVEKGILKRYGHKTKNVSDKQVVQKIDLQHITIPKRVSTIGGLKEPRDKDRFNTDIFYHPFASYSRVKTVVMSDQVKVIGEKAFEHCKSLTSIQMSKEIESIKVNAFLFCEKLSSVALYSTLKDIHSNAFVGCTALKMIRFHGTIEQWKSVSIAPDAFDSTLIVQTDEGIIYVIKPLSFDKVKKEVEKYQESLHHKLSTKYKK